MNLIDTKTVIISYIISNAVCAVVMTSLWWQNRRRFAGLGFWLADFIMQFVSLLLVALRGAVPDWVSMVVGNALVIAGTILLYMGLERFVGKRGAQIHNAILLAAFIFVHTYFVLVQPSLTARNINLSLGLLVICFQCAWLMLRKVDAQMRPITRSVGVVFAIYCLVSIARVVVDLAVPSGNDVFHSNIYDTLLIMTYQMFFIVLTFSLFLMVSGRLFADLEHDIAERKRTEKALRLSETKFSKAFHSSPDAILISRVTDGRLVEVNEGFSRLSEYSREEALTNSTIALGIWADPQDRARCIAALRENHSIRDREYDFRTQSGRILNCLYSGEIIYLGDEAHILSVVRDITERKWAEKALRRQNEYLAALQETTLDLLSQFDLDTLLENIVKRAGLLTGTSAGYLDLLEPETGQLRPRVGLGALAESLDHVAQPGEGVAGTVWQTGKPLVIEDYDQWPGRISSFSPNTIRSIVGVPLLSGDQVVGVLGLAYDTTSNLVFKQEDVKLLTPFAQLATIAIENARLFLAAQQELAERKQAEDALRESESKLRALFEILPVGVSILDAGHKLIYANPALERILDIDREHLFRGDYRTRQYLRPDGLTMTNAEFASVRAVKEQRAVLDLETGIVKEDGSLIWTSVSAMPVAFPDWRVVIVTTDITERKRVEEILQMRLRLLEFAATHSLDELMQKALDEIGEVTNSPIGFYHFVEADQKTLSLQAWSTRTLSEFCQAEGKGLHYSIDEAGVWVDCVHQRKPVIHNDYAALPHRKGMPAGHAQVIRELVVPTLRDGRVVSILGVGNKPSDYDEQDVEFVSYIADVVWVIVERKRMEDDLRKAKEAAEAANRAKSVFLANMSHELRTPLNAILGFSDLMTRDRSLSAEQQENLSIINRSGEHLLSLINDVLDMAKIESGRVAVQEHAFDLYHLLDGLVDLFRARATDKGLTLILNRAPDVPRYIVSDESKLRQILINLLGNAVKFTEEGGIGLRVRVKTKDEGQKTDQAVRPSSSVVRLVFELQDTGPGIAPQELETIFEPFVQSASGYKTTQGTGLGLAICRQFAHLMGGELTTSSVEATGVGALFELDLPVRRADVTGLAGFEQPEKARAIGLAPGQPVYRLLVAEDHEENRQLLVKLLTQFGFEVRTAENGLQAIQVWQEWQPHLIWMDMRMPVMDGHEATRRIKATPQGQQTIIIALTASAFEDERERVLVEGCDDFVRKPFREDEIVDRLVQHLGVRFVYEGAADEQAKPQQPQETLDLAGLPVAWLADLRQAAIEADADHIAALAEQIREQRPAQASALVELVSNFDYDAILNAVHRLDT